jgi:hypothetical protein
MFGYYLTRGFLFGLLTFVWYFNILLVAVPLSLWYLYHYRAYEFIFLGVLIDIYFLPETLVPLYTLIFTSTVVGMEFLKPQLRKTIPL